MSSDLIKNGEYNAITFGTLPENIDHISPAAIDLLKRLLQPEPSLRIKSVLGLQRIAFYMGHDIPSFSLKKVSYFLFNVSNLLPIDILKCFAIALNFKC